MLTSCKSHGRNCKLRCCDTGVSKANYGHNGAFISDRAELPCSGRMSWTRKLASTVIAKLNSTCDSAQTLGEGEFNIHLG